MSPVANAGRRPALIFVYVVALIDVLSFGLIVPVLPGLVEQFLSGDTARAATVYGVFGMVWALMQLVFSPLLGALSDRFGRRPVILISCFGLGLDFILMALAPNLAWLFLGRVISGITAASFSTAGAYLADVTPPEKRGAAYGMLGSAFGIGFVVGPAIGGVLGGIDPRAPFWAAAVLALINACYGLFVLPESLPPERRSTSINWRLSNPIGALNMLRANRELAVLAGIMTLHYLAHCVLPSTFVLYAGYRYGWDERAVGLSLMLVGTCSMVVQAGLVRPAIRALGERRTVLLGLAFEVIGYLAFSLVPSGVWVMVAIVAAAPGGLMPPALQAQMTRQVQASEQGRLQGANGSIMGLTGIVGPGLFTLAFAFFIAAGRSWTLPGAPFLLAAMLVVVALVLALRIALVPAPIASETV